jgi:small subunit ribosomal protein S21
MLRWHEPDEQRGHPLQVLVRDNNVDQALRVLKKKMQREGVFREMKQRKAYEKPSERKAREKAEAVRRSRKIARKQAIREGLIAAPKTKPRFAGPRRPGATPSTGSRPLMAEPKV